MGLVEGEDYYLNEDGYKVFTEKYHLKRGFCCKNKCKHCPYGFTKESKNRIEDMVNSWLCPINPVVQAAEYYYIMRKNNG
jgi:hypothetical protein